jgi:hypothetical protein
MSGALEFVMSVLKAQNDSWAKFKQSPMRGSVVAVVMDNSASFLGTVAEKVAGGLFEVVFEDENGETLSG